jgi:hypothetical protein
MEEVQLVAIFVAKVLLYLGGVAFLICFLFGAKVLWEVVKLAFYTQRLITKWGQYKRLPVEARGEADKSGYFDDDTKEIK